MLPANLGVVTANQMQSKRELSIKPVSGGGGTTLTVTSSTSSSTSNGGNKEELRYLPIAAMPTKPCGITIGSYNNNNNNNNNNNTSYNNNMKSNSNSINNKTKLTPMNIVQKQQQLKPKNATTTATTTGGVAPPLIQLVAASTNPNPSLLSLLTPKALVAPNPAQPQPVLIRPTTTMTTIPATPQQLQQQQQQQNGSSNSKGATQAAPVNSLMTLVTTTTTTTKTGGNKTTPATPSDNSAQISLISNPLKSRAPFILSKAAVEKIRVKFGQVQAQANSGALILTKSFKCNKPGNNNTSRPTATVAATPKAKPIAAPMPAPMPLPMPLPAKPPSATEIKISPLPATAAAAVNLNGAKILKVPGGALAVVVPAAIAATPSSLPAAAAAAAARLAAGSAVKLQRSKSLAGNSDDADVVCIQSNSPERRHSVAIMSKEVDVIETPKAIETITIDDDDSEEEEQQQSEPQTVQQQHQQQQLQKVVVPSRGQTPTASAQNSRKNSTTSRSSFTSSSSSDLEIIMPPTLNVDNLQQQQKEQQKEQQQMEQQLQLQAQQPPQKREQQKQQQQQQEQLQKQQQQQPQKREQQKQQQQQQEQLQKQQQQKQQLQRQQQQQPQKREQQQQMKQQQQQLPPKTEQQELKELLPGKLSILKAESLSKEEFEQSLHCTESTLQTSPSAVSSTCSSSKSVSSSGTITVTPIARLQKSGVELHAAAAASLNNFKRNMQLNFNMLRWRDQQPGTLSSSTMRFELNRFNLLQLQERCEPRHGPASYFERALFDRPGRRPNSSSHPLLYLCSRCNCHGPASDFLAPRFCSVCCVRRAHKRRQPNVAHGENKISRMQDAKVSNGYAQQLQKQTREKERVREHERERERKPSHAKRPFRWTEYLKTKGNGHAAPIHLFLNPFPISPNCFERGMKLEAIDPENCSLFCVCTIVDVRGYRLKLNFDGYSSMYDFWVNADSMDIFPPGWCEKTAHVLQAPKGYCPDRFTWYRYLVKTNAKAAPCSLFTHLNGPTNGARINGFSVGMHLEAEDLNDTGKICVATVADILDERIRVHFDGWDDCYDFWVHVNSPYIHPCGWHEGRQQLIVPPDYQNVSFNWADYITEVGGIAAPVGLFAPREPMEFQPRMKLEVVDQRNPCLIRPATVVTRKGYRVQLHLDCWPTEYYFWLEDDSPDLHPIGWCEATSHELETPPGFLQRASPMPCDVEGCRGFGNAKRFNLNVHALRDCCPYAPENWRQWRNKTVKPPRVQPEQIKRPQSPKTESSGSKATSPLLLSRLSKAKSNTESKIKAQGKVDRTESKPKVKREDVKPLPTKVKNDAAAAAAAVAVGATAPASASVNQVSFTIAKSIVSEYGPQFARNYRLWQKNSDFDMSQLKSNPMYWTNWDVYEFVERALKSSSIAQLLFDEEIDGRALLMMGRKDLSTYLKLKVGPTVKLFSLIVNLRIAVASKFETKTTGLNLNHAWYSQSQSSNRGKSMDNGKHEKNVDSKPKSRTSAASNQSLEVKTKTEPQDDTTEEIPLDDDDDFYEDEFDCKQYPQQEISDEDDVVLDADDFLSVKPSQSIVHPKRDMDVVMQPCTLQPDVLQPATVATIS